MRSRMGRSTRGLGKRLQSFETVRSPLDMGWVTGFSPGPSDGFRSVGARGGHVFDLKCDSPAARLSPGLATALELRTRVAWSASKMRQDAVDSS